VLAAGTAAQASLSAVGFAVPVLAPTLRGELGLSLGEIGILMSAEWVGSLTTLLAWGLLADRVGERLVLVVGLAGCGLCLVGVAYASSFAAIAILLALAGASGSSVNSASGRAVMGWFPAAQRGLALGLRQTAIPLGGLVAALVAPPLAAAGGREAAFLGLAGLCLAGAVVGGAVLREGDAEDGLNEASLARTLRDARLWRVCVASGLFLYAQVAVIGFGVLFLYDEHGFSERSAALVLAAAQVLAVALRIAVGRWSDVLGSRIVPLRRVGVTIGAALAVTAAAAGASSWLLVPVLAVAGGLSMAWNGLSFAAAAELAGRARSGAAIGLQQTSLAAAGVVAPLAFAGSVSASSWALAFAAAAAFPLAGVLAVRPLTRH
jgi:sugar phosphate permease